MGDEKFYTIQVKGTAYRFRPLPDDDLNMVVTVLSMGVGLQHSLLALSRPLSASLGGEQWGDFIRRMVAKELTAADLTKAFETLLKRQTAAPKSATRKSAKGLDVASSRLAPADDAE